MGYTGTLLLHHPHYDKDMYDLRERQFREKCCAIDDTYCDKYFSQRQINNGEEYEEPAFGESKYIAIIIIAIMIFNVYRIGNRRSTFHHT